MIDERHEELASLYAFDLLEGTERAQFEAELARDPALQQVVTELRTAAASLAHAAPSAVPPAALKQRVLGSIAQAPAIEPDKVIRPAVFSRGGFVPWAIAACLALGLALLGQRYITLRTEADGLQKRQEVAQISLQMSQQQLEADRLVNRLRIQEGDRQMGSLNDRLAQATTQFADARTQLTARDQQLAALQGQVSEREQALASARAQLSEREKQVATLTQQVDALAGTTAEIGRQLGESKQQVARLTEELKQQIDLADLKITALASMLKNSPQALAVAVWDPRKQEGILNIQNLPPLAAHEDYQLWVVDPQYPNPVDGGVFHVEAASATSLRIPFKARQPVGAVNAFAVTRERKGGVPKAEGPFVLLGK